MEVGTRGKIDGAAEDPKGLVAQGTAWSFIKLNPSNISVVQIPGAGCGRRGGRERAGSGAIVKIPRGLDALEIRVINRRNSREYTPGLERGGGGGDGRLKNASNA